MKNQYFGDKRDYFKYGLVQHLLQGLPGIQQFTFVAMLTPNDGKGDGKHTDYREMKGLEQLHAHLQQSIRDEYGVVRTERRDVHKIKPYFEGKDFECPLHDDEFRHDTRADYFAAIPQCQLEHAVILLDPDNGLEIESMGSSNGHKFVRYQEVGQVYRDMGQDSVLVIYQHHHRKQRCDFYPALRRELEKRIQPRACACISDNEVAFIVLSQTGKRGGEVREVLRRYAEANPKARVVECMSGVSGDA